MIFNSSKPPLKVTPLGWVIKRIRIEKGMLLKDMADKMNVSSPYVSAIENGREEPTPNFILETGIALELNRDELIEMLRAYRDTVNKEK